MNFFAISGRVLGRVLGCVLGRVRSLRGPRSRLS